jgi:hypothetical protein
MTAADLLDRLLFRRQFLLGPKPFAPAPGWSCRPLRHGLTLSTHPDLQVQAEALGETSVTLLGFALDPFNPASTEQDIVRSLAKDASDVTKLIRHTKPLAGRWAIIYQNQEGTCLFTDPCGNRTVFYYPDGRDLWCGSQPEIIRANCRLSWNTDEKLLEFLMNPDLGRRESRWIGAQTLYQGCLHLMPNHYLDCGRLEQVRFYPTDPIPAGGLAAAVDAGKAILEGIFVAAARRHEILMPLTAGWDSRVLLAASRSVSNRIRYFVDRMGVLPEHHPDVRVPSLLSSRLGIDFEVRNSYRDLPGWFSSLLSANVTRAKMLPKTRMLWADFVSGEERLHIDGQAGEIPRERVEFRSRPDANTVSTAEIARFYHMGESAFAVQEIDAWRQGLSGLDDRTNLLMLFDWEQRYGNWGAQHFEESAIAFDEFSPYSCRLWIETMLATPRPTRALPDFQIYRSLIESMWPEVLSVPINPRPRPRVVTMDTVALRQRIRPYIPSPLAKLIKNLVPRSSSARRRP